jgi:photosystem II stability/assembly factor-like uncharacterized protein
VLVSRGPADAVIVATADGGLTWTAAPAFNDRANFPGVSSVGLRILWSGGGSGVVVPPAGDPSLPVHVVVSGDGGATWRATFPAPPAGLGVNAANALLTMDLAPDGRGALFVRRSGQDRGVPALFVCPTADAGVTWGRPVRLDGAAASPVPRALFALDDTHWWASSGAGGALVTTADGGRTIRRHEGLLPSGYVFRSLVFSSPDDGWAVATSGGRSAVFGSHDGGATWRPVRLP